MIYYAIGHLFISLEGGSMLVAYGPDNQPIVAEETPLEQLHHWSHDRILRCPNCRGYVHVRGGPEKRTQLHFAHQRGECAWSTEAESVRHARGKMMLAQWLRDQFPDGVVTLEKRLPEPNRIADVSLLLANGQQWAIEFQCAPLEIAEWKKRHDAYRRAGIIDTWIIGSNRYEKHEAFIEAVQMLAHEILFLDPLVTPPRAWLRWSISQQHATLWQHGHLRTNALTPGSLQPSLQGRTGRLGFGLTFTDVLPAFRLSPQAHMLHPVRSMIEKNARLLTSMTTASEPDVAQLSAYLSEQVDATTLHKVVLPFFKAYQRDPELLRRYNYGRGTPEYPLQTTDIERVQKAYAWLTTLNHDGYSLTRLREIFQTFPYIGPYAALASYAETLLTLASRK